MCIYIYLSSACIKISIYLKMQCISGFDGTIHFYIDEAKSVKVKRKKYQFSVSVGK